MKILFEVVTVLFSFNCVYPVVMYYIYDDNPIAGYVSNTNEIGSYAKSRISGHKKYLASGSSQNNMKLVNERAVDSHFKISKSSPISFAAVPYMEDSYTQKMRKGTEPPLQKNFVDLNSRAQQVTMKNIDIPNYEQSKASALNDVEKHINEGLFKPNIRNYFENLNVFNKPQNIEIGAQKSQTSQTSKDTQKKLSKINNQPPYFQQNYYQKSLTSSVKDKVLHKANIKNEQNAQLMTYMLNEIAKKFLERKSQKQGEYRKRNAMPNNTFQRTEIFNEDPNNKHISKENVQNHYKNGVKRGKIVTPRIGSYDLGVEIKDTPYALFYRTNHENIEQSDFFSSAEDRTTVDEPMSVQDKNMITMSYAEYNGKSNRRSVNAINKNNNNYAAFRDR